MFKPIILKRASYIALVCCSLGVLFAILISIAQSNIRTYISILSWTLLIYASWLATRLSVYDLYDEDRKSLGYYIYGILILFVLYLVSNISMGILPAIFLVVKLRNQKAGIDRWMQEKQEVANVATDIERK